MAQNGSPKFMVDYAMQYGTWLGILFVINLTMSVLTAFWLPFQILYLAGLLFVPVLFFRLVQRYASKVSDTPFLFSHLWSFGILTVIFASLLSGVCYYIFFQYIDPDFIPNLMNAIRENVAIQGEKVVDPKQKEVLEGLSIYLNTVKIPSAIQFVFEIIWFNIFWGSLGSIAISLITVWTKRRRAKTDKVTSNSN